MELIQARVLSVVTIGVEMLYGVEMIYLFIYFVFSSFTPSWSYIFHPFYIYIYIYIYIYLLLIPVIVHFVDLFVLD